MSAEFMLDTDSVSFARRGRAAPRSVSAQSLPPSFGLVRSVEIGEFDALTAAHAMTLNAILVTNNTKHFTRVRGLRTENWL